MTMLSNSISAPTNQQVSEAIDWLVKLETGDLSAAEQMAFERWQAQSPQHQLAWQRLGRASQPFTQVASLSSIQALQSIEAAEQRLRDKRRSLKTLASFGGLGMTLWLSRDYTGAATAGRYLYGQALADITTAAGEQKSVLLDDGGKLLLNTRSALGIDFNNRPQLELHYGELAISNSGGAQIRAGENLFSPAVGAEFTLSRQDDFCRIQVVTGEVNCVVDGKNELVAAGQKLKRQDNQTLRGTASSTLNLSWRDGFISAERTPLDRFVAQLARYRPGYLTCTAPVGKLTLSGSFPIGNTDLILENLCQILPLRQQRLSRYWVRLVPA